MMTSIPLADCSTMLGIDPKTLRHWLKQARIPLQAHPTDARLKCLTLAHVQQLATLHGRPLQSPAPALRDGAPVLSSSEEQAPPTPESEAPVVQAANPLPISCSQEADLRKALASLETKVTTMQEHLAQLALELLRERGLRSEQRLSALEALLPSMVGLCPSPPTLQGTNVAGPADANPSPARRLHPAEQQARSRVIPLIEYGAAGAYVVVCPQEGALQLTPDSPEWFDWFATLSSFRFVGQQGRFTAYRDSHHRRPTRSWTAHRCIHGRHYKHYLGVTDRLTIGSLEQMAAQLQAHLTSL